MADAVICRAGQPMANTHYFTTIMIAIGFFLFDKVQNFKGHFLNKHRQRYLKDKCTSSLRPFCKFLSVSWAQESADNNDVSQISQSTDYSGPSSFVGNICHLKYNHPAKKVNKTGFFLKNKMDVSVKTNQTTVNRTVSLFFPLGSAQPPVEDSACHFASARPLIRGCEVCYSRCKRTQGKMSGIPCGSTEIVRDYSCDGCIMPCSVALGPCKDSPSLLCLWILN